MMAARKHFRSHSGPAVERPGPEMLSFGGHKPKELAKFRSKLVPPDWVERNE
jgi:hypothetical protein